MVYFWEMGCKLNCKESQGLLFLAQNKKSIGFEPFFGKQFKTYF